MQFDALDLPEPLLRALDDAGYVTPTPIQVQAIPHVRDGRDLFGCAQTGTGKTAAFALPILAYLDENRVGVEKSAPRVLVLAPTRELAAQIGESFHDYGKYLRISCTVVFGGVGQEKQVRALREGVHVLVATPGRLLDLLGQGLLHLDRVDVLVLDEADRMLDMGFLPDVRRILEKLPRDRQSLLFSATMPNEIRDLASRFLHDPVSVSVTPVSSAAGTVTQSVYFVEKAQKRAILLDLIESEGIARALVFTRTKHGANRVAEQLQKSGVNALAIHGNKSQNARERALGSFKDGNTRVLVATDLAARGIDVDNISHVVNFDVPNEPESYVHRIGRTGRAGASGLAITLCDRDERGYLAAIERLTGQRVPVADNARFALIKTSTDALHHDQRPPRERRPARRDDGRAAPRRDDGRGAPRRDDGRGAPRRDDGRAAAPRREDDRSAPRRDDARVAAPRDAREPSRWRDAPGTAPSRARSEPGRSAPRAEARTNGEAPRGDVPRAPAREGQRTDGQRPPTSGRRRRRR